VLHTRARYEFGEDTLKLLVHIASLISGAIENAQLYDRERRRVNALTGLSELAQQVAAATAAVELGRVLVGGTARLLHADACQLLRLEPDGETLALQSSLPDALGAPSPRSAAEVMLAALDGRGAGRPARGLWPGAALADLLVTPLAAGGERVGLLCVASSRNGRSATRTWRSPARSPISPRSRSSASS